MRIFLFFFIFAVLLQSCKGEQERGNFTNPPPVPETLAEGERLFGSYCAACHGQKAAGTGRGPSFLSPIYRPDHHGDESFLLAGRNGVRAHHWRFGDMPPVQGASDEELRKIVAYVRWLQTQAWGTQR